jgi:predicted DsbA family dithiol-disulfide isomerase
VSVKVVSDNVCPWCFVGKRNLESAMAQFAGRLDIVVEYFPFSLHGDTMPVEGMPIAEYLYKVYRIKMDPNDPNSPLKAAGERAGILFNNQRAMVNTLDSHRIIALAKELGKQLEMVEAIFHHYFEEAADISRTDQLVHISSKVLGQRLSPDDLRSFLLSDMLKDEVSLQISKASQDNVTGVPFFSIEGDNAPVMLLSGAQPPESFVQAFSRHLAHPNL